MNKYYIRLLIAIVIGIFMFSSCGKSPETASTNNPKQFTIVTSFYPMYVSAINVAKDIPGVRVVNMTEPQTGCLHDYQLSPSDLKTLESADVFVVNGAGMETFIDKAVGQMPSLKVIEASKGIELIKNSSDGEENPHVWVSITDAIKQVKNMSEQLALVNPDNSDKYNKNGEDYIKKLEALRDKMHKELDSIKNRDIVTFHESFPYFAKEFNLNIVSVIEREPGSEPSAGEIADTIEKIKKAKVKALFAEPQYSKKAAESIASQTGAKVYTLDPIVTGSQDGDIDGYIKKMEQNLKSLVEALKI
ncbi:metal ABC transporter substrate-binding protein [Pseudobacteroides cellulosolvens]|uniref:ABC-type metal ion transporter, periplasmic subunit n=1 Tax=Pseudobacteroides cellulosolvens ATCC 35603 = DSM 2933 TaxID=398512 RepID=A0A0L6JUA4_9FIRM|nr:metal ABC transporter substrate-binding protein [Pseudobacteroides cellulosolvens]KNY29299.1 ABC-type metal ion transporter, periplasmic subunit [Pseudobacteroides cellulosolvens ATCC 35603 = DSM 2933]